MSHKHRQKVMAWVGAEVLPHEAALRSWLRKSFGPDDLEDVIQEAYCKIAELDDVAHIGSGRAYLFATARSIVLMKLRRERVVKIEAVTDIDQWSILDDGPTPEHFASSRQELARVAKIIESLPERCRNVIRLRKIEGLSQREVAEWMGLPEHTVENDVRKGLKIILETIAEGETRAENTIKELGHDGRAGNLASDC